MPIFDSHCHYLDPAFDPDRDALLSALPQKGIARATLVGTALEDSAGNIELAKKYPYFVTSVGIHPGNIDDLPTDYLEQLARLAQNEKVVAIGEIGLDYHYPGFDKDNQKRRFREQLSLAKDLALPVIIHARDSTRDYLEILAQYRPTGVVHCFSGSAETAREILNLGMYIGVTGICTFQNAKKLKNALPIIPRDRLLLETDCPYMAPVPYRGKRCDSTMLPATAAGVARAWGISVEEVLTRTYENAVTLYGSRS